MRRGFSLAMLAAIAALVLAGVAVANSVYSSPRNLASYIRVVTWYEIDQPPHCVPDQYGLLPPDCFEWEYQVADLDFRLLRRTATGRWVRVYSSSSYASGGRDVNRIYSWEVRGGLRCGRYRLRSILVDPYGQGAVSELLPFRRRVC